ncbi:MAG: fimbrillin family protein, partial [Muribaculaceae bacterium]|nr:fimbrillin family protein [Muribaculaceae bacterium]
MKQYIYSAAAMLCVASFGLTSCQNDMEEMGNVGGKEVLLRVTANRGDAETRTTLESDGNGGLICKWSEGDKLLVVNNSNGKKIGVITIVDGIGTSDGTFEGKVTLDGHEAVSLVYLGTAGDADAYSADSNSIAINLSAQDGSFSSLSSKDVLTAEAKVGENSYLPTTGVVETSVTMTRQLAFGYFNLDFSGVEDLKLAKGDVITITGEGLKSEGKINFRNGGSVPTVTNYSGSTTIEVTKTKDGNDFYITMLPCGEVTPTFTVVKDGVTYTASLGAHDWKSGEFVRKDNTGAAVSVTMKMNKIDHSVNPLAKWAEGNLVRSGSGKSVTATISDNPFAAGSYYQFGRNYGYNSASEVTQLSTELSLSNNYFTFRGLKYIAIPENGIYSSSSKKVQAGQNASSVTSISDHPAMFFMNAGDYVTPGFDQTW